MKWYSCCSSRSSGCGCWADVVVVAEGKKEWEWGWDEELESSPACVRRDRKPPCTGRNTSGPGTLHTEKRREREREGGRERERERQRRRGSEQLGNRAQWSAAVIRDEGTIRDSNIIYHYTLHSILHSGAYGTCVNSANIPDHKHKFLEINLSRKVFIKIWKKSWSKFVISRTDNLQDGEQVRNRDSLPSGVFLFGWFNFESILDTLDKGHVGAI